MKVAAHCSHVRIYLMCGLQLHSWFDTMSWVKIVTTLSKIFLGDVLIRLLSHTKNSSKLLCLDSNLSHTILEHVIRLSTSHHVISLVHIHLWVVHQFIGLGWASWVFVYVYWLIHFLILFWSYCSWLRSTCSWLSSVLAGSWWFNPIIWHLWWNWWYLGCIVGLHLIISRFWSSSSIFLSNLFFHMLNTLLGNDLSSSWSTLTSIWSFWSF